MSTVVAAEDADKALEVLEHLEENLPYYYKVEADMVVLSNDLREKLKKELDDVFVKSGLEYRDWLMGRSRWEYCVILRPYIEEALGRKWTTPPLRWNDEFEKWAKLSK